MLQPVRQTLDAFGSIHKRNPLCDSFERRSTQQHFLTPHVLRPLLVTLWRLRYPVKKMLRLNRPLAGGD